ncbi:hypothetical protein BDR06DRAFT_1011240 [Suillus hirtellus]|nr:hypothetical protein BDR06DRAFT_1011240 [Suillus hirtellus]
MMKLLSPLNQPSHSPPYHMPIGSSGSESVTTVDMDYISYKWDSYQSNGSSSLRVPSLLPTVQKAIVTDNAHVTLPAVSKFASNTPPLQAMKTQTPDKSLPVHKEPEDDIATSKNSDNYAHGNDYNEDISLHFGTQPAVSICLPFLYIVKK